MNLTTYPFFCQDWNCVELYLHFPILCHRMYSAKFIFFPVVYLDHIQYDLTSRGSIQRRPLCWHLTLYHIKSLAPLPNAVYLTCCITPHTLRLAKPLQTVHYTMHVDVYIHTRHTPLRSGFDPEYGSSSGLYARTLISTGTKYLDAGDSPLSHQKKLKIYASL